MTSHDIMTCTTVGAHHTWKVFNDGPMVRVVHCIETGNVIHSHIRRCPVDVGNIFLHRQTNMSDTRHAHTHMSRTHTHVTHTRTHACTHAHTRTHAHTPHTRTHAHTHTIGTRFRVEYLCTHIHTLTDCPCVSSPTQHCK